jgi:hypothetical protein
VEALNRKDAAGGAQFNVADRGGRQPIRRWKSPEEPIPGSGQRDLFTKVEENLDVNLLDFETALILDISVRPQHRRPFAAELRVKEPPMFR